ncbi:MAG: ferrous iron transport protein A [Gemmataceae bacterium]|nr:ferrous iron transport protein A [Gemmataceae bacterium]
MTLAELTPGRRGRIASVTGEPALVQRLYELGLCDGDEVEVLAVAPLGDPIEVRCGGSRLSLRKSDAHGVILE